MSDLTTLGQLHYTDDGDDPVAPVAESPFEALGLERLLTLALSAPLANFVPLNVKAIYRDLRRRGLDPIAYRVVHTVDESRETPEIQTVYTFYGPSHPRQ